MQRRSPGPSSHSEETIHEDPLLIAQTLTYVTDDGSVQQSYSSAGFSNSAKLTFVIFELLFLFVCIVCIPTGAHGTAVWVTIGNMTAVAWFWYNYVNSVELSSEGGLRFWIGNQEIFVPFDKIISLRKVSSRLGYFVPAIIPHRGFLSVPSDGVAVVTTLVNEPFFLWPRSAGKPERKFFGCSCPKLTIVFSPVGGSLPFIREVENEMRHFGANGGSDPTRFNLGRVVPPSFPPEQQQAPVLWIDRDNPHGSVSRNNDASGAVDLFAV